MLKRHRASLFTVFLLVAVVFGGDRLIAVALHKAVMSTGFRYAKLYRGEARADIVVAGNSRALHALFVPDFRERLGCEAFHMAYNAIPMTLVSALVQDYLDRNDAPERLFVEVTCLGVDPAHSAGNFTMFLGESERLRALVRGASPRVADACEVAHLYRFNGEMFTRSLAYLRGDDQRWISPSARVASPEVLAEPVDESFDHLEVREENIAALRALLSSCEARGVEVTLFVAPFAPGVLEPGMVSTYIGGLEAALGRGIEDYSDAVGDVESFSDRVHTNRRGAGNLLDAMITRGLVGPCDPER